MFKSYEFIRYLEDDKVSRICRWEYKIVDDDFEEITTGSASTIDQHYIFANIITAVIDIYEKRNLNVSANIFRAFNFLIKAYELYDVSIVGLIEFNKQHNSKFAKYENDMNKYLMLV